MKRVEKFNLCLGLGGVLFTLVWFFFINQTSFNADSKPMIFSSAKGRKWIEQCIEKYPEILWLANSDVRKTEEGQAKAQEGSSEQLFGEKYVEFDRSVMTIRCLKLILDGDDKAYIAFTAAQPNDVKLSRESFNTLHLQGKKLLKSKWKGMSELQIAQTMETALILGDIGKSERARELFKPYGIKATDHDDFYEEFIQMVGQNPMLCHSFARLPVSAKKLLAKVANLVHFGHVTHLEGGVEMFEKLKESGVVSEDPVAFSFDLFVHTCDVAGALGHVNHQSSIAYTEYTHRAIQAMTDAIKILSNPHKSELDVYETYLSKRALWLGLNPEDDLERVLARVGAMLRLFTPEEGVILRKAMVDLKPATQNQIIAQLSIHSQNRLKKTPTYMPTVLVNLSNNAELGTTKEMRLFNAVIIGVPFIARVLERYQELLSKGEINADIPLNFNKIAGIAKISPKLLEKDFYIDSEGNIDLISRP